jgi:membrane associated rhomboid family serine protease
MKLRYNSPVILTFLLVAILVFLLTKVAPGAKALFVLVALLFLRREILDAFRPDQVSQFAHILGGATGGLFGLLIGRRK